ncbi:MAG: tetratricopeptide repeat protein [Planctomycetes bacterium]|nr:tetratricopeptide repeat protein [Planctomycetota bacterium]
MNAYRSASIVCLASVVLASGCAKGARVQNAPTPANAVRISEAHAVAYEASRIKDPGKAAERYEDAIGRYDNFPAAWNNLGVAMMQQERYLEAEQAFARAAEQSRNDPRPLYNRGLLWMRRHYPADARKHFNEALERDPYHLPSLRGSVECDIVLREPSETTLDNIRRALMLETDKKWLERLESQRVKIQSALARPERSRSLDEADADLGVRRGEVTDRERQMIEDAIKARLGEPESSPVESPK